jgi:hypothetical protein
MEERGKEGRRRKLKTEESFSIKDYWDEAMRKLKEDASK